MASNPTPAPDLLTQALTTGLKLNITGTLPGEELVSKILDVYKEVRETMDPDLRKRWDAVTVQQIEDVQSVWRGLWVKLGVLR